jgi:hypothetical protein
MKAAVAILAAALLVLSHSAAARISEDTMCWDPDVEHPTYCEDEE